MKKHKQDYFIGLDLGTNSVGWAVTDTDYNLLKGNRKHLWGVRLFDTANTAADRRLHRAARRRNQRKVQRLHLLREIFEDEIQQVDTEFLQRLQESPYHLDDRSSACAYSLFNDKNFTDKDFHKKHPTIYHLRSYLVHNPTSDIDIRELFLAIHSILKSRGHFLFSGESLDSTSSLTELVEDMKRAIFECFNVTLNITLNDEEFGSILKKKRRTEKRALINDCFVFSSDDEELTSSPIFNNLTSEIKTVLASSYFRVSKLFNYETYSEFSPDKVEFDNENYEAHKNDLEILLNAEEFRLIEIFEAIYNWSILSDILRGHEYISDAKVEDYETHKSQLRHLKDLVKKYVPEEYGKAFKSMSVKNNYVHYIGKGSKNGKLVKAPYSSKCNQEDVNKYFYKLLQPFAENGDGKLSLILDKLDLKVLLPKLRVKDNRVIPYQVNLQELKVILDNYKEKFTFLTAADEAGYSPIEKIISLATFRIPYYVGPLNTAHVQDDGKTGFAWMKRQAGKDKERLYPWNFNEIVDTKASAEIFIKRMTNKCTYLDAEDVIPKNSLLYKKFMVLNELNNLRINNESIPVSLKQKLYSELFSQSKTRITTKRLRSFLVSNNIVDKDDELIFSGIDNGFTNTLSTWIDFAPYRADGILSEEEIERIVEWKTVFGEDDEILFSKITEKFSSKLNESDIRKIVNIVRPYKDWGRFSKKFLEGIYQINYQTGELKSIISLLWETNNNLMELLSNRFGFLDEIEQENSNNATKQSFSYESLVEPLQFSPAVKRPIWQTLLIVNEIRKIMKTPPRKIFIEMARERTFSGRTKSRKENLQSLYASCKNDQSLIKVLGTLAEGRVSANELQNHTTLIESKSNEEFRNDRLYLYYTQLGKCLYSGQPIALENLYNTNLYDIDHIYPQSLIKDDSLNNRVLVRANYNSEKGNTYPVKGEWQELMEPFWNVLASREFITKEKYLRLTRRTPLSEEELASFINRQIVETRQSSLQTARLLVNIFEKSETEIVYVKAPIVSAFRTDFDIQKSRLINDHHHAHDAYLNIVVGNVYHTKFTNDARNFFIKHRETNYNIRKLFYYDIIRNGEQAWEADTYIEQNDRTKKYERLNETGTIKTVRKTMRNNQVLVTTKPVTGKGELFNLQPLKKGKNLLPLKESHPIFSDTEKYGGYTSRKTGYFFIVEHTHRKKRIKQILTVPIMYMREIINSKRALLKYCTHDLHLIEPKIIIPSIHLYETLQMNGFEICLRGTTGKQITAHGEHQLILPEEQYDYFVQIEKLNNILTKQRITEVNEDVKILAERLSIKQENNITLYQLLLEKEKNTIYALRPANQANLLKTNIDMFANLDILKQCKTLIEIVNLFTCNVVPANLSTIGGGRNAGSVKYSNTINDSVILVRKSPTGVFRQEVHIN